MSADALREQIRAQVRTALGAKATGADTSVAALMQRFEAGYAAANAEANATKATRAGAGLSTTSRTRSPVPT